MSEKKKQEDRACMKYLKIALEEATKDEKKYEKEDADLWQLVPVERVDIKKYLSIDTDERMRISSEIQKKRCRAMTAIGELHSIIFFQGRK